MAEAPKRIVAGTHHVLGINVWRDPERRQDLLEGGTEYVRADIHEAALKRQAAAARTLHASTLDSVRHLQERDRSEYVAAATLESEREANALLTAENERLRAELERRTHPISPRLLPDALAHPTPDGCGREGKHQWGGPDRGREVCVNCGATRTLEGGDDG